MSQRKGPALGSRPLRNNTNESDSKAYCRQLRLRRAAASRLPLLACGRADPCQYGAPCSGYSAAAMHLIDHGLLPAPNRAGLEAMWRHGGRARQLAELIAERWAGAL